MYTEKEAKTPYQNVEEGALIGAAKVAGNR